MRIQNVGRGIAIISGFTLIAGDGLAASALANRNLGKDEFVRFAVPFKTTDDAMGVAFCEDRYNAVHVWSALRKYRRYKKNQRDDLTPRKMIRDLYDGHDIGEIVISPVKQLDE